MALEVRPGHWLPMIRQQTEPVTLTDRTLPRLVTFADIDGPASVASVDPDALSASFGLGATRPPHLPPERLSLREG